MNPLRLYLLASILFFFAVNYGAKGYILTRAKFPEKPGGACRRNRRTRFADLEAGMKKENIITGIRQNSACFLASDEAAFCYNNSDGLTDSLHLNRARRSAKSNRTANYGKVGDRPFVAFDDAKSTTPFERWIEASGEREDG